MQTVTIQVQDSFMPNFLHYVESQKENISITKDKNLELDPYFYERQKKLQNTLKNIENKTAKLLSQDEYEEEMELFFQDLEKNNEDL